MPPSRNEQKRERDKRSKRERERKPLSSFEMIQPKPNSKLVKAHPYKNSDSIYLLGLNFE